MTIKETQRNRIAVITVAMLLAQLAAAYETPVSAKAINRIPSPDHIAADATTVAISGTVSMDVGSPEGVEIRFGGSVDTPVTSMVVVVVYADSVGSFTASIPIGFTGAAVPSFDGYNFSPIFRQFDHVAGDVDNVNFTGFRIVEIVTLSGTVTADSGSPGGILVEIAGVVETSSGTKTVTESTYTDPSGYFSAPVPSGFTGTVAPISDQYDFTPTSHSLDHQTSNQSGLNFSALRRGACMVVLSGQVTAESGLPEGILIAVSGGVEIGELTSAVATMAYTDAGGAFSLTVPIGFSGSIQPSSDRFWFDPAARSLRHIAVNTDGLNFQARTYPNGYAGIYRVWYKKPGDHPREISNSRITSGVIRIEGGTDFDTLKIIWEPGRQKPVTPPPFARIVSSSGFRSVSTVATVFAIETSGTLGAVTATGAHIQSIKAASLKQARMTWNNPDVPANTTIDTSEQGTARASLQLNGVKLRRLTAPLQSFSAVSLSTKKTLLGVAESGAVGLAGASGRDIDVRAIGVLNLAGASMEMKDVFGEVNRISGKSLWLVSLFWPANIHAAQLKSSSAKMTLTTAGGNITGAYLARGRIALVKAVTMRHVVMRIGGRIGATSDTVASSATAIFAAGVGGSEDDIDSVYATLSINAVFIAGAEDRPTSGGGGLPVKPTCSGALKRLNMDRLSSAEGWVYMNGAERGRYPRPYPNPIINTKFADHLHYETSFSE